MKRGLRIPAALLAVQLGGCAAQELQNGAGPSGAVSEIRAPVNAARFFDAASPTCGLQAAIDAAGDRGGLVEIPPGDYVLRRSLALRGGVTLRGSGPATILRMAPASASALAADCPAAATEIELQDATGFRVGDAVTVGDTKQRGWHSTHAIVRQVKANRLTLDTPAVRPYRVQDNAKAVAFFPAITAAGQADLAIESLRIDGGPAAQPDVQSDFTSAAIHLVSCIRGRVRDVTVTAWPADGISLQRGSDMQVIGCLVERCLGEGIHPGTGITRTVFNGNIARANRDDGFFFCARVTYCTVSGNVFCDNGLSGIGGCDSVNDRWNLCSGNVCAGNGRSGIELVKSSHTTVVGNVCTGNSRSEPGRWAGITLADSTDCLVASNRCGDEAAKPTQLTGIAETGKSDRNVISGNGLTGSRKGVATVGPATQASNNAQ